MKEAKEFTHNDVMANHHKMKGIYHLMYSMQYTGKIKDEVEFREIVLPLLEMVLDRDIEFSKKTIDQLTDEAREQINKIGIPNKGDI